MLVSPRLDDCGWIEDEKEDGSVSCIRDTITGRSCFSNHEHCPSLESNILSAVSKV